ncbi:MAG: hypothetical protein V1667_00325 [bacterium]
MKNDKHIFTEEEINNFAGFYNTLRKVHDRLIREGYKISDGKITPPKKQKQA